MEWFIQNQTALVFSAFVFLAWLTVQLIKFPIKKFGTVRIKNKEFKTIVDIIIVVPISVGVGFMYAYFYDLIYNLYNGINFVYSALCIGALTVLSHNVIFNIFINVGRMIYSKYQKRQDITLKDLVDVTQQTIQDSSEMEPTDDKSEPKYEDLMDTLKKL